MPMYETTVKTPQGEEKKRIYADTPQEAKKLFEERQYQMSFYAEEVFIKYLDLRRQLPLFANARSIKNIVNNFSSWFNL